MYLSWSRRMKITILDGHGINPGDLDFAPLEALGEVVVYSTTLEHDIVERSRDCDVLIVNKVKLQRRHIEKLTNLSAICLFATGFDNVDVVAAKEHGVSVYNAIGYGTESVAQHVIAMMLSFTNRVESHHRSVMAGDWATQQQFSYSLHTITELSGKSLGIIGYGRIGQRVGDLARSFGMNVLVPNRGKTYHNDEKVLSFGDLLGQADYLSLHAPLTDETRALICKETLSKMQHHAIIINTGRGDLINETDLAHALNHGKIAGAALDVVSIEPPDPQNPSILFSAKNCVITPHMAWRSIEARTRLLHIVAANIQHHIDGTSTENRIV